MKIIVIGLSGKKGHGKDTFANLLKEAFNASSVPTVYTAKRAFADALKDQVADLIVQNNVLSKWEPISKVRSMMDDPIAKEKFRSLMQVWGTEVRRNLSGPDYWVNEWNDWMDDFKTDHPGIKQDIAVIFVPDVRFPNEVQAIKQNGGILIRVDRLELPSVFDEHESETLLDKVKMDYKIGNTTLEGLRDDAERMVKSILKKEWK